MPLVRCRVWLGPVSAQLVALWLRVCLSVCLLQIGVLSKGTNESIWFLVWSLFSTSPTLRFKDIQVSTVIRVVPPSGTLSPNSGLRKFRYRISIVERVVSLARER